MEKPVSEVTPAYKSHDYFLAADHYAKKGMLVLADKMRRMGNAMLEWEMKTSIERAHGK